MQYSLQGAESTVSKAVTEINAQNLFMMNQNLKHILSSKIKYYFVSDKSILEQLL